MIVRRRKRGKINFNDVQDVSDLIVKEQTAGLRSNEPQIELNTNPQITPKTSWSHCLGPKIKRKHEMQPDKDTSLTADKDVG